MGGSVGGGVVDFMGIQLNYSEQFSFPGSRDRSLSAWGGAPRDGIQSAREEAFEDTHHGVLAAQHHLGDLARRLAPQREQQHLVARARFGIGGFLVATAQLGQRQFIHWREGYGSGHLFFLSSIFHFSPSDGITSPHTLPGSI